VDTVVFDFEFLSFDIVSDFDLPAMPYFWINGCHEKSILWHGYYSVHEHVAWQAGIQISNLFSARKNTDFRAKILNF